MEGIDQKAVVPSTVLSKHGKTVADAVPKASQTVDQAVKQSVGDAPLPSHPDRTRFGDWERAGRCIDF